jgi:hypothetical protein
MNAIPRTAYRFRTFLPSKLSNLLAICPLLHSDLRAAPPADDCSWIFSPLSPLLLCNSSRVFRRLSPFLATLHLLLCNSSRVSPSDFHPRLPLSPFLATLHLLLCNSSRVSPSDFHPRLPLSPFLAVNAICQGYQCYSSLCLPLSALLAIRATDFLLRCRLFLPSTPSVRAINAIPPAAYRFRLFLPSPPSVRAINAIPPSAYRFRLCLPSAPSVRAMNAIPRTAYRFRTFLPSNKLSNLLAICPLLHSDLRAVPPADDCSWIFSPLSPLLLCNSSRVFRRFLPSLTAFGFTCSQRHLSGL